MISRLLVMITLFGVFHLAQAAPLTFMLTVTTADTTGRCLYQGDWLDVSGRYHAWDLKEIFPKKGSKPSKDDAWRVVRSHLWNQLRPTALPSSTISATGVISSDISFAIPLLRVSEDQLGHLTNLQGTEEYKFLKNKRSSLANERLVLATVTTVVPESNLARLNRHNRSSSLKDDSTSDSQIIIPLSHTVCEITPNYLMQQSTAIYTKGFLGRKTMLEDNTKPMKNGTKTFAQEFIER